MTSPVKIGPLALALALAAAPAAMADVTNSGSALAHGVKGAGAGTALIAHNQAAANYPTAASFTATRADGIREPITADDSPGSDRLAMNNEPDKLVTTSGEVRLNLLIGHPLYSTDRRELGQIKDITIPRRGEPQLIVDVDGHLVAVPWSKLWFGLPGALLHGRAVLAGGSRAELRQLPAYRVNEANG